MRLAAGSFTWLVAHDLRLAWRGTAIMFGNAGRPAIAALVLIGAILLHAVALPVADWLTPLLLDWNSNLAPLAAVLLCTFTWMLAQSLFAAARTLYVRGDLDLLLGSPLRPRRVFAAKAAGIAAGSFGSVALLILPVANAGAFAHGTWWLGVYPTLAGLALTATGLGLALTIAIHSLVGAGRARLWTQMSGAVIAGAFVLGAQVVAVLPRPLRDAITTWLDAGLAPDALGLSRLVRLPLDAVRGDTQAAVLLVLLGLALFSAATGMLGQRFAAITIAGGTAAPVTRERPQRHPRLRFHTSLGANMRRKEWRLLARDPGMFAQLALQIIYTIPVAVVLLRNEALPPIYALAPTIVVVAAQVAASLAWLTVSGEDAPELIATAPITPAAVKRAKLYAIAWPVAAILLLPLLALAAISWRAAVITTVISAAAATSTALLNFWHPMPGNRRGMLRRHSQSKLIGLVEHGLALLWATVIVLALLDSALAAFPIATVVLILALFRRTTRH